MNWFLLIPIACAVVMLFIEPATLMVMAVGVLFIFAGAYILEKIFGPRTKKG